jgi:hypothetical protein
VAWAAWWKSLGRIHTISENAEYIIATYGNDPDFEIRPLAYATPPADHSEDARHMVTGAAEGALTDEQINEAFDSFSRSMSLVKVLYREDAHRFARCLLAGKSQDGTLSADDAVAGIVDLFPSADRQALNALAELLCKPVLLAAQPAAPVPHANCPAPADETEAAERKHLGCAHCSTGIYATAEPAPADRQGVALSEREAFECYARSRKIPLTTITVEGHVAYEWDAVEKLWKGWQARASPSRAEVERDAARYRWLCEEIANGAVEGVSGAFASIFTDDGIDAPEELDSAIDAAIRASKEQS